MYTYIAYKQGINMQIVTLTKEGLGIRSTARVLRISTTTLLKRILFIAKTISRPAITLGGTYEVDEIRTFIKHRKKLIWIVYAINRGTKEVVCYQVGRRTNNTLFSVLNTLHLSGAKKIYTDKLKNYAYLIDASIHHTSLYGTNHIERKNLTLRTHLKRLSRKTICFSRSLVFLSAILQIYFWANDF